MLRKHKGVCQRWPRSPSRRGPSLSSTTSLCVPPPPTPPPLTVQRSPQSSPDLGPQNAFCRFSGQLRETVNVPVMGPWDASRRRMTQSHSSAVGAQLPAEAQRPSCPERQTCPRGRTPALRLAPLGEKGGPVWTADTSGPSVCVENGRTAEIATPACRAAFQSHSLHTPGA